MRNFHFLNSAKSCMEIDLPRTATIKGKLFVIQRHGKYDLFFLAIAQRQTKSPRRGFETNFRLVQTVDYPCFKGSPFKRNIRFNFRYSEVLQRSKRIIDQLVSTVRFAQTQFSRQGHCTAPVGCRCLIGVHPIIHPPYENSFFARMVVPCNPGIIIRSPI